MKAYILVYLAAALSTVGSAAVIQQDLSDYGNSGPDCTTNPLNNCILTGAPGVIGQTFGFSGNSNDGVNYQVFDFQITGHPSNFTLTFTGTLPFISDQMAGSEEIHGYGIFLCGSDTTDTPPSGPLCTSTPTAPLVSVSPISNESVAFHVTGNGNGIVFFVVENQTSGSTVTATLTSVPEPGSFSLLIVAGLAAAALGRRRLARLF